MNQIKFNSHWDLGFGRVITIVSAFAYISKAWQECPSPRGQKHNRIYAIIGAFKDLRIFFSAPFARGKFESLKLRFGREKNQILNLKTKIWQKRSTKCEALIFKEPCSILFVASSYKTTLPDTNSNWHVKCENRASLIALVLPLHFLATCVPYLSVLEQCSNHSFISPKFRSGANVRPRHADFAYPCTS